MSISVTSPSIEVLRDKAAVRAWSREQRAAGKTVGLVPTMGALHDGHLSLARAAVEGCDATVMSIFVNPAQFGPGEDLDSYPKTFDDDCRMAQEAGIDVIYAPDTSATYPDGYATYIEVHGLQDHLCGASRPVFFRGIATVVAKLFNVVEPTTAYFGQKDAQQAAIIQRMTHDLDFDIDIRVMPLVREADGLAMSSRNRYLTPEERERGLALSRGLSEVRRLLEDGERSVAVIKESIRHAMAGFDNFDYAEVVDLETIQPVDRIEGPVLIAAAGYMGKARLIDNIVWEG